MIYQNLLCQRHDGQKECDMDKQENVFAVKTKSGCIEQVGKSVITQPKIKFTGGQIKWFDDSQLLKSKRSK